MTITLDLHWHMNWIGFQESYYILKALHVCQYSVITAPTQGKNSIIIFMSILWSDEPWLITLESLQNIINAGIEGYLAEFQNIWLNGQLWLAL